MGIHRIGQAARRGVPALALGVALTLVPLAPAHAGLLGGTSKSSGGSLLGSLQKTVTTVVTNVETIATTTVSTTTSTLAALPVDGAGEVGPVQTSDPVEALLLTAGSTVDLLQGDIGLGTLAETVTCPVATLLGDATESIPELSAITDPATLVACALHFLDLEWHTTWTGAGGVEREASVITTVGVPTPISLDDDATPEVVATATLRSINEYSIELRRIDGGSGPLPGTAELVLSDPTGDIFPDEKLAAGVDSRGGRFPDSLTLGLRIPGLSLAGIAGDPRFVIDVESAAQPERAALHARFFSDDARGDDEEESLVAAAGFAPLPATISADLTMRASGGVHAALETSQPTTADLRVESTGDPDAGGTFARQALGGTITNLPRQVTVDYEPSMEGSLIDGAVLGDGDYEAQVIGYKASSVVPELELAYDSERIGPGGVAPLVRAEATITDLPTQLGIVVAQERDTGEQRVQAITPAESIGEVDARFALNGELVSLSGQRAGLRYESSGETTAVAVRVAGIDTFGFRSLGGGFAGDVALDARQSFDLELRDADAGITATGAIEDLPAAAHLELVPGGTDEPLLVRYSGGEDTIGHIGFELGFDDPVAGVVDSLEGAIEELPPTVDVAVDQGSETYTLEASKPIGSIDVLARDDAAIEADLRPEIAAGATGVAAVVRDEGPFALHGRILGLKYANADLRAQHYVVEAGAVPLEVSVEFDEVRTAGGERRVLGRTLTAAIDRLPERIDLNLGLGDATTTRVSYSASAPIGTLTADLRGDELFEAVPKLSRLRATLRDLPKDFTARVAENGALDLDATTGIGEVDALATSGPDPELPGDGHGAYLEAGAELVAKVRLFGFKRFSMTEDPLTATLETTASLPLHAEARVDTDGDEAVDLTGAVDVHDVPTSMTVTYEPESGVTWTASDEIASLVASGTFAEDGRSRTAQLEAAGVPAEMAASYAVGDGGATSLDYSASDTIDTIDVRLEGERLIADLPSVELIAARAERFSQTLTARIGADGAIAVDAGAGIGLLRATLSGADSAPTLPDSGHAVHLRTGDEFVAGVQVAGLRSFTYSPDPTRATFAADEPHPLAVDAALDSDGDGTAETAADLRVRDVPASLEITFDATTGLSYEASDAIDEISGSGWFYENVDGELLRRDATLAISQLPARLAVTYDVGSGDTRLDYSASGAIDTVDVRLEGERLIADVPSVRLVKAHVEDFTDRLTARIGSDGAIAVDAGEGIGLIQALVTSGDDPDLPEGQHAVSLRTGDELVAKAQLLGFRSFTYAPDPTAVTFATAGAHPLDVDAALDLDGDGSAETTGTLDVDDVPASLAVTYDAAGRVTYDASSEIESLTAAATFYEQSKPRDATLAIAGLPTALSATYGSGDDARTQVEYAASGTIEGIDLSLSGDSLVPDMPAVDEIAAHVEGLTDELTVDLGDDGSLDLDAGDAGIGLVSARIGDGSDPDLPATGHALHVEDTGTTFVAEAQIEGLDSLSYQPEPLRVTLATEQPAPLRASANVILGGDVQPTTAELRIDDVPATLAVDYDPGGAISYLASSEIGSLTASGTFYEGARQRSAALDVAGIPTAMTLALDQQAAGTAFDYSASGTIDRIEAELEGDRLYAAEPVGGSTYVDFVHAEVEELTTTLSGTFDADGSFDVDAGEGIGRIAFAANSSGSVPELAADRHVVSGSLLGPAGNEIAAQVLDFRSASYEPDPFAVSFETAAAHPLEVDADYWESARQRTLTADVDALPTSLSVAMTTSGEDASYAYTASNEVESIDLSLSGEDILPGLPDVGYLTAQVDGLPAFLTATVAGDGEVTADAADSVDGLYAAAAPSADSVRSLASDRHGAHVRITDAGELESLAVRYLGFTHAGYVPEPFALELSSDGAHPLDATAEIVDAATAQTEATVIAGIADLPASLSVSRTLTEDGEQIESASSSEIGSIAIDATGDDLLATAEDLAGVDLPRLSQTVRRAGARVEGVPASLTLTQPYDGALSFEAPGGLDLARAYVTDGSEVAFADGGHQLTYVDDGDSLQLGGQLLDVEEVDFALSTAGETLAALTVGLRTSVPHPLDVDARLDLTGDGSAETATVDVDDVPSRLDVSVANDGSDTTLDYEANARVASIVAELEGEDLYPDEPKRSASVPGISYVRAEVDDLGANFDATFGSSGAIDVSAGSTEIGRVALFANTTGGVPELAEDRHVIDLDLLGPSGNSVAAQLLDFARITYEPDPLAFSLFTLESHVLDADAVYYEEQDGAYRKRTAAALVDRLPAFVALTGATTADSVDYAYSASSAVDQLDLSLSGDSLLGDVATVQATAKGLPTSLSLSLGDDGGVKAEAAAPLESLYALIADGSGTDVPELATDENGAYAKLTDEGAVRVAEAFILAPRTFSYAPSPLAVSYEGGGSQPLDADLAVEDTATGATEATANLHVDDLPASLSVSQVESADGSTLTASTGDEVASVELTAEGDDLLGTIEQLTGTDLPDTPVPIKTLGIAVEGIPGELTLVQPYDGPITFEAGGGIDLVRGYASGDAAPAFPDGEHYVAVLEREDETLYAAQLLDTERVTFDAADGGTSLDVGLETSEAHRLTASMVMDLTGDGSEEWGRLTVEDVPAELSIALDSTGDETELTYDASSRIELISAEVDALDGPLWAGEPKRNAGTSSIDHALVRVEDFTDAVGVRIGADGSFGASASAGIGKLQLTANQCGCTAHAFSDDEHEVDATYLAESGNTLYAQLLDFESVEYVNDPFAVTLDTTAAHPLAADGTLFVEEDGSYERLDATARIEDVPASVALARTTDAGGTTYDYSASAEIASLDAGVSADGLLSDSSPVDTLEASFTGIPKSMSATYRPDGSIAVDAPDSIDSMAAYAYDEAAGRPELAGSEHSAYAKLDGGDLGSTSGLELQEASARFLGFASLDYEPSDGVEVHTDAEHRLDAELVLTDGGATTADVDLYVSNVPATMRLTQSQVGEAVIYDVDNSANIETIDIDVSGEDLLGQVGAGSATSQPITDVSANFADVASGVTALSSSDGFSVVAPGDGAIVGTAHLAASSTGSFPSVNAADGDAVSITDDGSKFEARAIFHDISAFTVTTDPHDALQTTCSNSSCTAGAAQCYSVDDDGGVTYDSGCGSSDTDSVLFVDVAASERHRLDAMVKARFLSDEVDTATLTIPELPSEITLTESTTTSGSVTTNDISVYQSDGDTDIEATLTGADVLDTSTSTIVENKIKTISTELTNLPTQMDIQTTSAGEYGYSANGPIDQIEAYATSGDAPTFESDLGQTHQLILENSVEGTLAALRVFDLSSFSIDTTGVDVTLGTDGAHPLAFDAELDLDGDFEADTTAALDIEDVPTRLEVAVADDGDLTYEASDEIDSISADLEGFPGFEAVPLSGEAATLAGNNELAAIDLLELDVEGLPKHLAGTFAADEYSLSAGSGEEIGSVTVGARSFNPPSLPTADPDYPDNYAYAAARTGRFRAEVKVSGISSVDAALTPQLDVTVVSDVLNKMKLDAKILDPDRDADKYLEGVVTIESESDSLRVTQGTDADGDTTYTTTTDQGIDSLTIDVTNSGGHQDWGDIESASVDLTGLPATMVFGTGSETGEISFEAENASGGADDIDLVEASINGLDEDYVETGDYFTEDHASGGYPDYDRANFGYLTDNSGVGGGSLADPDGADLTWDLTAVPASGNEPARSAQDGLLLDREQDGLNGAQLTLHGLRSFSYKEERTDDCDLYEQDQPYQTLSIETTKGRPFYVFDKPGYGSHSTADTDSTRVTDPCWGVSYDSIASETTYFDSDDSYLAAKIRALPTSLNARLGYEDEIVDLEASSELELYLTGYQYPDVGTLSLLMSDVPEDMKVCVRGTPAISSMRERLEAAHPQDIDDDTYDEYRKTVATASCAEETWTGYTDQSSTQCLGPNNCQPSISLGVRSNGRAILDGIFCGTGDCTDSRVQITDLKLPNKLDAWVASTKNGDHFKGFGYMNSFDDEMTGLLAYYDFTVPDLISLAAHLAGDVSFDEWHWKVVLQDLLDSPDSSTVDGDFDCDGSGDTGDYADPITGGDNDHWQMRLDAGTTQDLDAVDDKKLFAC